MDSVAVDGRSRLWRSRWAAIGAAVAVTLGGGGLLVANAASSAPSSVITVNPARILDTRENLGLPGPFERSQSRKLQVTGTVATKSGPQMVVPAGATGVLLNVTAVCRDRPGVACQGGFLAVRPGDASGQTQTSSLNFSSGVAVPNSVQVGLPAVGNIDIVYGPYVAGAQVDVVVDVVGYMITGAAGPTGPTGAQGQRGFSSWDPIPSGRTVTGSMIWGEPWVGDNKEYFIYVPFPGKASPPLPSIAYVNFAPDASTATVDDDGACTGTVAVPTAPPGKVCIYRQDSIVVDNLSGRFNPVNGSDGFYIDVVSNAPYPQTMTLLFSWAYTAP